MLVVTLKIPPFEGSLVQRFAEGIRVVPVCDGNEMETLIPLLIQKSNDSLNG